MKTLGKRERREDRKCSHFGEDKDVEGSLSLNRNGKIRNADGVTDRRSASPHSKKSRSPPRIDSPMKP